GPARTCPGRSHRRAHRRGTGPGRGLAHAGPADADRPRSPRHDRSHPVRGGPAHLGGRRGTRPGGGGGRPRTGPQRHLGGAARAAGTVKVLRDEPLDRAPAATLGLASLEQVAESARAAGLEVSAEVDVDPARLPRDVDAVAFRIVQESMTNVLRHSTATQVAIAIGLDGTELVLDIAD